jgi:hypothetical protein
MSANGNQPTFDAPAEESLPVFVLMVPSLQLKVEAHVIWGGGDEYDVAFVWPQHKEHGSARSRGAEVL